MSVVFGDIFSHNRLFFCFFEEHLVAWALPFVLDPYRLGERPNCSRYWYLYPRDFISIEKNPRKIVISLRLLTGVVRNESSHLAAKDSNPE